MLSLLRNHTRTIPPLTKLGYASLDQYDQHTNMDLLAIIRKTIQLTNEHSVRSNKRTDAFHHEIGKLVISWNPSWTYTIEHAVPIPCGRSKKYKADIAFFDPTAKLVAVVLAKCSMNNISQNEANLDNVKIGECVKVRSGNPDVKIYCLDIIPVRRPYYFKDGSIKHWETTDIEKDRESSKGWLTMMQAVKPPLVDDKFVIYTNNEYPTPDTVVCTSIADSADFDRFRNTILAMRPTP